MSLGFHWGVARVYWECVYDFSGVSKAVCGLYRECLDTLHVSRMSLKCLRLSLGVSLAVSRVYQECV